MGRPSSKRWSARRPGKRERARVKKHHRTQVFGTVAGAGTYELKAGRKKWSEFHRSRRNPFGHYLRIHASAEDHIHLSGNHISKAGTSSGDGQPVSTAECNSRPAEARSREEGV